MTLLTALGPSAAGLAAANASSTDRLALTDVVVGISAATRSADHPSLVAHIAAFRRTLLTASNNPLYVGFARTVDQIESWASQPATAATVGVAAMRLRPRCNAASGCRFAAQRLP